MERRTLIRMTFAIVAIAFFATPVTLRAVGVTATSFENRRFAEAPRLSQGWDAFQQTTRFLTDRLPLREQAVRANNRIWRTLFGTSPRYGVRTGDDKALPFAGEPQEEKAGKGAAKPGGQAAQVLEGRNGWLYLKGELERACTPLAPFDEALARWRELVAITRAAGKRAVLLVPPDKGSIHPEHLPDGAQTNCALAAKRQFWKRLAQEPRGSGVRQLERPLARLKARTRVALYTSSDSHWTSFGALELVRAALDSVGGPVGLGARDVEDLGARPAVADLSVLRGDGKRELRPRYTVRRARGAPRVPGDALFVYDSFGDVARPLLAGYFERFEAILWFNTPARRLIEAIARADTVVFETVEREFAFRGSDLGPLTRPFLRRLRARLASR